MLSSILPRLSQLRDGGVFSLEVRFDEDAAVERGRDQVRD
jgi:hypothetical protein